MARPHKQTVDYFPHDTDASEGKTLTIIQAKYGNDGYAFWFKLLQLLGKASGHFYDFNNPADWEFLLAKTHQKDTETAKAILETLALLGAIDKELYENGIIWCQKFVDRVTDAYNRTIEGAPKRPQQRVSVLNDDVSVDNNSKKPTETPQTKLKDTKLKDTNISSNFDIFWKAYPKKKSKGDAEKVFGKIKPDNLLLATIVAAIGKAVKSDEWLKNGGEFIPHPATWLNRRCWEDEYPQEAVEDKSKFGDKWA